MTDINFLRNISNINQSLEINRVKPKEQGSQNSNGQNGSSFQSLLQEKFNENALTFSKHATERIEQRNISLNESVSTRLNEAVTQAKDKGLKNVLVMIDTTAFIVNTMSNKVVTAVNNSELKDNIFTNIDGAVIK